MRPAATRLIAGVLLAAVLLAAVLLAAVLLAAVLLAGCGKPSAAPTIEAGAAPADAADPSGLPASRYAPSSTEATTFTGEITVTPLAPASAKTPAPLRIESATGLFFETQPFPDRQSTPPAGGWAELFGADAASRRIEVHEVVRQEALAGAPGGGLCGEEGVYVLVVAWPAGTDRSTLSLAAYGGNEWPPAATARCGVYSYTLSGPAPAVRP